MNVIYLKNMATQEYIRVLEKYVKRVLERRPELTINQMVEVIGEHFDESDKPTYAQVHYIIKYLGYRRTGDQSKFVLVNQPRHLATRTCMRCGHTKPLRGGFKKVYSNEGDVGFGNYLLICQQCVKEENKITGESIADLNAIYGILQQRYGKVIDRSMYDRFWEPAMGLR